MRSGTGADNRAVVPAQRVTKDADASRTFGRFPRRRPRKYVIWLREDHAGPARRDPEKREGFRSDARRNTARLRNGRSRGAFALRDRARAETGWVAKGLRRRTSNRRRGSRPDRLARSGDDRAGRLAVILDTNAVSGLFAGDPVLEELLEQEEVHHLPVIVIGEYRYGLARSKHGQHLERLLNLLIEESIVLPIDEETTRHYAEVRQHLRRAGTPIPENDLWIAALAHQHALPIVSRDTHFDLVEPAVRRSW